MGVGSVCFRHILYFTGKLLYVAVHPATVTHYDNKIFVQVWESLSSFDEQNKHDACNIVKLSGIASTSPLIKFCTIEYISIMLLILVKVSVKVARRSTTACRHRATSMFVTSSTLLVLLVLLVNSSGTSDPLLVNFSYF